MRWVWPLLLAGCVAAPDLREDRRRILAHLREYTEAGRYPVNDEGEGETPIFVDRRGTPCAVAYLMLRSGREDLVRRVVEENNFVRIGELADGPVLGWIRTSGLTQAECARIQPSYRRRRSYVVRSRLSGSRAWVESVESWAIPAEYQQRPHLVESRRVFRHLSHVLTRIEETLDGPEPSAGSCEELFEEPDPWLAPVPDIPPFPADWRSRLPATSEPKGWTLEAPRPGLRLRFH